jgi:hypothetical protein
VGDYSLLPSTMLAVPHEGVGRGCAFLVTATRLVVILLLFSPFVESRKDFSSFYVKSAHSILTYPFGIGKEGGVFQLFLNCTVDPSHLSALAQSRFPQPRFDETLSKGE